MAYNYTAVHQPEPFDGKFYKVYTMTRFLEEVVPVFQENER